ncbi:YkvA family protein [Sporohalobacter salinus]|uniref:YkvA family protein n=1 Tax=Sporohalobacter salinus TaxID=1494606 RepID=UPI0023BAA15B|nr:YkvA family protein [Sporohalobacter salinus]
MKLTSILRLGSMIKRVVGFLKDKNISKVKKMLLVLPIIYVISPIDLVSDFLPIFGWLDDVVVLTVVWNFFLEELKDYELKENTSVSQNDENDGSAGDYILNDDDYQIN